MIFSDIIEYNIVGDTKTPLLRCIPFISKVKSGDIISTGQYMDYQSFKNLQFKKLLKNSFHSIKIELRDSTGEKIPFVFVGITRVVLLFRKISIIIFEFSFIRNGCSKLSRFSYFLRTRKTTWKRFWSSCTNSWENCNPLY